MIIKNCTLFRTNLINIVSLGTNSNGGSSERDHHDVPYPPPDAFLLPQQPRFEAGEDDTEDDDDDDDDAQSIKSYGSDHIRQIVFEIPKHLFPSNTS